MDSRRLHLDERFDEQDRLYEVSGQCVVPHVHLILCPLLMWLDVLQEAMVLLQQEKAEQQALRMELAKGEHTGTLLLTLLDPCRSNLTRAVLCCSH